MSKHRVYGYSFASVYPHYVTKVEKKGRTKEELDQAIQWLTGYDADGMAKVMETKVDLETFYADAPAMNPNRDQIKGKICGVQIEEIEEDTMREIRYLDKLVDEIARGRPMQKILRGSS